MLFKDYPRWITKSAGTNINAVQRISLELINWADKIIVMEAHHYEEIINMETEAALKINVLGIEDRYYRCSPALVGKVIIEMSKRFELDTWVKKKFHCS